jgi:glycosyltransferase involved in cell wall biosynthesis
MSMSKVLLAIPTRGQVRIEWATGFRIQAQPTGMNWDIINIMGHTCDDARNVSVQVAKDGHHEFVMFFDDDMVPYNELAFARLINGIVQNPEISALGGVYPRRYGNYEPIVIRERGSGVWWGWEDGNIHKVFMTGTGFTIFRIADLPEVEQYPAPDGTIISRYFQHNEYGKTDDVYLAEIFDEQGLGWYVHGNVQARQMDIDGKVYDFKEARELVTA